MTLVSVVRFLNMFFFLVKKVLWDESLGLGLGLCPRSLYLSVVLCGSGNRKCKFLCLERIRMMKPLIFRNLVFKDGNKQKILRLTMSSELNFQSHIKNYVNKSREGLKHYVLNLKVI